MGGIKHRPRVQAGRALPYATKVAVEVGAEAQSATGVNVEAPAQVIFRTIVGPRSGRPARARNDTAPQQEGRSDRDKDRSQDDRDNRPARRRRPARRPGAAAGARSRRYYLELMNCTRTGGWVTSTGECSSPGGRDVAPLKLDAGISTKVRRPYAKQLAVERRLQPLHRRQPGRPPAAGGLHELPLGREPRLPLGRRHAPPSSARTSSSRPRSSYNGGHYVNLMNPKYDRVGIGVWVSGGRVRLVDRLLPPLTGPSAGLTGRRHVPATIGP